MKKAVLAILIVCAALCRADFSDDFESYDISSQTNVRNVASSVWTAITNTGQADIFDDGTGNQVLAYGWNDGLRGVFCNKFDPVANNTTNNLLSFSLYINAEEINHSFGLTDRNGDSSTIFGFQDYEVQFGITGGGTIGDGKANLYVRDGGSSIGTGIDIKTWYNVWAVIDQVNDTYDAYLGTGDADLSSAVLIADDADFRNSSAGEVGDLVALLGLGYKAQDQQDVWIDNVSLGKYICSVPAPGALILSVFGTAIVGRIRRIK